MRLLSFALLYCLQLQSAAQSEYQIRFQRFGSGIISLQCQYMPSTGSSQFLQINETIRYWVNITMGERPANFEPDLERRLRSALIFSQSQSEPSVTFKMSPELEGLYTCGRMDTGNNVIAESDPIYLTSQRREGIPERLNLAAVSGSDVTFSCPYDVGRLSGCYYGEWLKGSTTIVEILNPGLGCRNIRDTPASQKYLIDRITFSLTITDVVPADSGNYTCALVLVDPQSPGGQTVPFTPLVSHSLSIDAPPLIIEGPEDEVVGMNDTTKRLSTSVTFTCTAVGLPAPRIIWTYNASLTGEEQIYTDGDPEVRITAMVKDQSGAYNGRFRVTSTLVLPILPTDGGTVTCKTGSGPDQLMSDAARLTVLGAPLSVGLIRSCEGELVYEVFLPVRLNRPAVMKFLYMNDRNALVPRIGTPAEVEVSDTNRIFFREDRTALPFPNYRVVITLSIVIRNQIRGSPSFTSVQTINANELSRGAVIGIAAGVGGFAVSVLLLCLCAGIVSFLILRCRAKGPIEGVRRTIRDIGRNNIDHDSETLKIKLDDLTKDIDKIASLLRLGHDGEHDPDVDKSIESFKESVENALDIINRITNTNANIQNPANNSDTAGEETTV